MLEFLFEYVKYELSDFFVNNLLLFDSKLSKNSQPTKSNEKPFLLKLNFKLNATKQESIKLKTTNEIDESFQSSFDRNQQHEVIYALKIC